MASTEAEAADWLDRQLTQLAARLESLIDLRRRKCHALLGDPGSDNWSGGKRRTFDTEFHREQEALKGLRQAAFTLRRTVRDARDKALKDNN